MLFVKNILFLVLGQAVCVAAVIAVNAKALAAAIKTILWFFKTRGGKRNEQH
jgi:hypothetical protein